MHIPDNMLNGTVCPVAGILSLIALTAATPAARKDLNQEGTLTRFITITAFIFSMQMLNFPVASGTSGHFMGGVFAAMTLGIPLGLWSIASVLIVQSMVFSDGGLLALGANILNMGILGACLSGLMAQLIHQSSLTPALKMILLGTASWFSIMIASASCSLMLAFSGSTTLGMVLPSMLKAHALIGIGEAVLTVGALSYFGVYLSSEKISINASKIALSACVAILLAPLASGLPDGLEWATETVGLITAERPQFVGFLSDYAIPMMSNEILSTMSAGLLGLCVVSAFALTIGKLINLRRAS